MTHSCPTRRSSDLSQEDEVFNADLTNVYKKALPERVPVEGRNHDIGDGDVVIAAITSCTNTSNPSVLVAAGNAAGGYVVTERMLDMFKSSRKPGDRKSTRLNSSH